MAPTTSGNGCEHFDIGKDEESDSSRVELEEPFQERIAAEVRERVAGDVTATVEAMLQEVDHSNVDSEALKVYFEKKCGRRSVI